MPVVVEHRIRTYGPAFIRYGISYGAVAAMILSYSANKSILWMLIDGWFSWIYVLFYIFMRV